MTGAIAQAFLYSIRLPANNSAGHPACIRHGIDDHNDD